LRYMCLIYTDETLGARMSQEEMNAHIGEYVALTQELGKSGKYLGGDPLQPTKTAATVRVCEGKTSVTDGPYVETKEAMGGYFMIEARDMNEAIQIAARIPGARHGAVEVRPVLDF
jgi:hypothetical protein